jgi:hypothetical protein
MYQCKVNKVELIYLQAHSSYILQPLDVSAFSPLKGKYRQIIQNLAHLDDAAPTKKRTFIQVYTEARKEAWKPEILKKGWETAGLFPWNPNKSVNSSQVKNHILRPTTPPNEIELLDINTSASHQALYRSMAPKIDSLPLSNDQKLMLFQGLNKAGKAINLNNTWKAEHEAERRKFEAQTEAMASNKRKRIEKNPNTTFAGIEQIMAAQEAQAQQEREKASKQARIDHKKLGKHAELAAKAIQAEDYKLCLFEWQIDNYLVE